MIERVRIRINNETLSLLKKQIGKKIIKIGYDFELNFSVYSILVFNDCTIKLNNKAQVADCFGEEYPHFSAEETIVVDNIAYDKEKYKYIDVDFIITEIETITDKVTFTYKGENGYVDIQNGIILHDDKSRQIVLYAFDSIAEAIGVYFDRSEFDSKNAIEDKWPFEAENVKYERVIGKI